MGTKYEWSCYLYTIKAPNERARGFYCLFSINVFLCESWEINY